MKRLCVLALVSSLSACALNPMVEMPQVKAVSGWDYADAVAGVPASDWWQAFGSAELDGLIDQALLENLDIAVAQARLRRAQAQLTIAGADLLPSASAAGQASRAGEVASSSATSSNYQLSVAASYEIDLWGGNRARRDSALARYAATDLAMDSARTSVVASVASTYFDVLSLRQRMAIARENIELAEEVLELTRARYRYGAISELEVLQQQTQLASQQAALPALAQQERQSRSALAVLLGQSPQDFELQSQSLEALVLPTAPSSLPAQVLARRPDVQQAEAQLSGAQADIVAARAALYPNLSISANLGQSADVAADLLSGPSLWSLAGKVSQALFQGGRLKAQTEAARASYDELAAGYVQTVLSALSETDLALSNVTTLAEQGRWQQQQTDFAEQAFELANTRYRAGSIDWLSVLDAQRSLFSSQSSVVSNRAAQLQAQVSLYRSLGAVPAKP